MASILQQIVASKCDEVALARAQRPLDVVRGAAADAPPARPFLDAISRGDATRPRLIAEIKRASPSAGVIVPDFRPANIARTYARHGAAAISVLTDGPYFQGRLEHIAEVRATVDLPVLRKEFIVDEYQVYETREAGADAMLLIAEAIGLEHVVTLAGLARTIDLAVLVEVHDRASLRAVVDALGVPSSDTYALGINNRDLHAQRTDVGTCIRLARELPRGSLWVAESGIGRAAEVGAIAAAGASAMLIGEAILREPDMGGKIDELLGGGAD